MGWAQGFLFPAALQPPLDGRAQIKAFGRMEITFQTDAFPSNEAVNAVMAAAWGQAGGQKRIARDWHPVLARSLTHICAFHTDQLIGFVNVAWDGGRHAFLLDTSVHPHFQRQGIATGLVARARTEAATRGAHWLHVDYAPELASFYAGCGFHPTKAGLIKL